MTTLEEMPTHPAEWLDGDGYPTDAALERITTWEDGWIELLGFVRSIWWMPSFGWHEQSRARRHGRPVHRFTLATGGWSGNEDVIAALHENQMFWIMCWHQSTRGGKYIFEVNK